MRYRVTGVPVLQAALEKHVAVSGRGFERAVRATAQAIWEEADTLVPVETGALQASGKYWVSGRGWDAVGHVGYGNKVYGFERNPTEYAVYQHDDPFMRKWLEEAAANLAENGPNFFYQYMA